jgi:hypothetical protein
VQVAAAGLVRLPTSPGSRLKFFSAILKLTVDGVVAPALGETKWIEGEPAPVEIET